VAITRMEAEDLVARLGIDLAAIAARGLPFHSEADNLVSIGLDIENREQWMTPEAAAAWRTMQNAAAADGVTLVVVSAFRSVAQQTSIIERKIARGLTFDAILVASAPPGFSEHHTGRAIDIGTPGSAALEEEFADTTAFQWLMVNAARFGFSLSYPRNNRYGFLFEPWHWLHRPPSEPADAQQPDLA
jgi:D-alanyl-D-alanine carboxypeptidase